MNYNATAGIVGPDGLRALMAAFPTGVTVVTAIDVDGTPWGMTCSSVCSVALVPPTLLFCARTPSPTLGAVLRAQTAAVNFLHADARDVAQLFASGAPDRFDQVDWRYVTGSGGPHLTEAAHSVADCRIRDLLEIGDHTVVFAEVFGVVHLPSPGPLVYGLRQYGAWPQLAEP
jgi:flavin reductase (NADH)